jgi:sugar phosphate isomerase/epimerase
MSLDRRRFLGTSAALAAGSSLASWAEPTARRATANEPLFDISLAQWSFHRALAGRAGDAMDNLDFAAAARELGIGAVEYVNTFFKDKVGDREYLEAMKTRAADAGVRSLLIMCDGLGALGDADEARRKTAVEKHRPWLDAAKLLGCHSIRVNAQSTGSRDEQMQRAADGLRRLTEHGAALQLNVIVENHGGLSSDGKWLAGVIRRVDHERCGTLPDFGNFRIGDDKWYDRYVGVAELMPFAKAVSAKSHDFDDEGEERHTDYLRMMRIVLAAGYRGFVGIEYEGERLAEREGVLATKRLLERVRETLAAEGSKGAPAEKDGEAKDAAAGARRRDQG